MSVYNITGNNLSDIAYAINGRQLGEAYNINGNPLFDRSVQIFPNEATGTEIGKTLIMDNPANEYPLYEVIDFTNDSHSYYQSLGYDPDTNLFYKFGGVTTICVYDSTFEKIGTITLPESAGHTGDNCYYNGKFYFPGDIDSDGIYVWDVEQNAVNIIPVYGVPEPTTAPIRLMGGICNVPNEPGFLYIVYYDRQNDSDIVHAVGDKLLICKYEIATNTAEVLATYDWDCVYLQGSAICNGILYATCNSPTTGTASNYTGITLKAFRTDNWVELPSLHAYGNFEPEGMIDYPYGSVPQLLMGIAKYATFSIASRFSVPYRLV